LDGFTDIIDSWLDADKAIHRKQRHTAKWIFKRLRDEHAFIGSYTIIKDYVRERGRRSVEMFVPLARSPGHAQADFGEAVVVIGGVEQKAHFFVLDLLHSDAYFVRAYRLYRYSYTQSFGLILLTIFDLVVVVMIWHERR